MPHCCVPLCNAHSGKKLGNKANDKGTRISFHRVPKDPALLNEFARRINRQLGPDFEVSRHTCICSLHYKKEDFYEFKTGRRELRPNTLPTIFDHKLLRNHVIGNEKTVCPTDEGSDASDETQSGRCMTEDSNEATNDSIPTKKPVELLQFKEEKPTSLDFSDTERKDDEMDIANEATSCGTPIAYPGELLDYKLEEMHPNSDTESADEAIECELEEKDPLNISDTECESTHYEDRFVSAANSETQTECTVEELRRKLREMNTMSEYLKDQLAKEKNINSYYETQFVKLSKDLQDVQAELQETEQINLRIRAELVKLRIRSRKQSAFKEKES